MMQIVSLKIKYVVMHFNQSRNRLQNSKNIVIGHFNVNSLRNKFDAVEELVQNEIDIYFLSEKKKNRWSVSKSAIYDNYNNDYKLFRRDRNCHGEGILCYINENITSKTVNVEGIEKDCEIVLIEFSIKTRKWLCIGIYKPPLQNENNFLDNLSSVINMKTLGWLAIATWLLRTKTMKFLWICLCLQPKNQSCIDRILTFENSNLLEAGTSDHRSFIITALKSHLVKGNAEAKLYLGYSEFSLDNFKAELDGKLKSCIVTAKKKNVRFDNIPFMIKTLKKLLCVDLD